MNNKILKWNLLSFVLTLLLAGCPLPEDIIKELVVAPTISPNGGEFVTGEVIILGSATAEAKVYYTIDGSEPTPSSTLYSLPFTINAMTTVKAIAIKEGFRDSIIITAIFGREERYTLIKVDGGTFSMGSLVEDVSDEQPVHDVTVSNFLIGKYEITQGQYFDVMKSNPSYFKPTDWENLPVEEVTWYAAVEFCNKLSQQEGLDPCYTIDKQIKDPNNSNTDTIDPLKWLVTCDFSKSGYRLPTEAEWEYVAKGGKYKSPFTYSGSDRIMEVAWYEVNSDDMSATVGTKSGNALGVHDMSGNVWEWCWDWFENYSDTSQTNPRGAVTGSKRLLRGGSFYGSYAAVRVTNRNLDTPSDYNRFHNYGFRIVRSAP